MAPFVIIFDVLRFIKLTNPFIKVDLLNLAITV